VEKARRTKLKKLVGRHKSLALVPNGEIQVDGYCKAVANGSYQKPEFHAQREYNLVVRRHANGQTKQFCYVRLHPKQQEDILLTALNAKQKTSTAKRKAFYKIMSNIRYMHNILLILSAVSKKRLAPLGDMRMVLIRAFLERSYWKKLFFRYYPKFGYVPLASATRRCLPGSEHELLCDRLTIMRSQLQS